MDTLYNINQIENSYKELGELIPDGEHVLLEAIEEYNDYCSKPSYEQDEDQRKWMQQNIKSGSHMLELCKQRRKELEKIRIVLYN